MSLYSDAEHDARVDRVRAILEQARVDLAMHQVAVLIGEDQQPAAETVYHNLNEALDGDFDLALFAIVVALSYPRKAPEAMARKWLGRLSTVQLVAEMDGGAR